MDEAKRIFRPEFLNRLDDAIVFRSLTKPELVEVLVLEVSKVGQRLKGRQLHLNLDDAAKDFLLEKGYDPTNGARPMRRAVERWLEDPLAEEILKGGLLPNEPILVTVQDGKLVFRQKTPAAAAATPAPAGPLSS
jgi:ATP-dependent Clp protease ATP-binding subunit ClpC